MDPEEYLQKFTTKDLDNFGQVEKQALRLPLVKESLEYLLVEVYRFVNYAAEKVEMNRRGKNRLKRNEDKSSAGLIKTLEEIDEYSEYLDLKDRLYISKMKNLIGLQRAKLDLHSTYPNLHLNNTNNYLISGSDDTGKNGNGLERKKEAKDLYADDKKKELREFKRKELQNALITPIKEMKLTLGVTVPSKKVELITRRLNKEGWNAKKDSVWNTLRKMGYVEGKRL